VESAFNPTAYSRSHASGLWQFIPSTGKHYNLRQDSWLDERRDPVASTHAALDYLDYLFDYQGDWFLALASYNWGEGAVRRAIEKNEALGLNTDYLSLKMPNETRNYVPKLQAIKNIISNPTAYQIALPNINNEPYFTIVRGPSHMDIEVAARLADMSIDEFTFLNPAYQRDIIPKDRPLILLPKDKAAIFEANLTNYRVRLSRWETYEPIPGESYADIAKKFNMSLSELRNINGARSTEQRPNGNQVLLVAAQEENAHSLVNTHIDSLGVQVASLEDLAVFQQQVQLENPKKIKAITTKNQNTPSPAKEKTGQVRATLEAVNDIAIQRQQRHQARNNEQHPTKTTPSPEQKQHIIQRGDTLYGLARQYSTSVQAIKKLNNLRSHTLPLGKRLFIPS